MWRPGDVEVGGEPPLTRGSALDLSLAAAGMRPRLTQLRRDRPRVGCHVQWESPREGWGHRHQLHRWVYLLKPSFDDFKDIIMVMVMITLCFRNWKYILCFYYYY